MKNKLFLHCFLFCLVLSTAIKSQNEASKWYFGNLCGLDFSTSPPTSLSNGALNTSEGCASISDNSGNLLFYTDGITVYNRVHAIMANGTGLNGDQSSTQSAVIIKKPGSSTIYYIFTEDAWVASFNGLCYSEVDMALSAGMGSVTVKNYSLFNASWEKIAAVKHCNGSDIWVISRDANSNIFRNYLVTQAGVSLTPVTSAAGIAVNQGEWPMGQMKVSPNGKKLGVATCQLATFEIFDFDASTGIASNPLTFIIPGVTYGCEFSPDGTKFYGASWGNYLFQWDLCAGSYTAIQASQLSIPTNTAYLASLQLGPDGKIYISRQNSSYVSVINTPNTAGLACNFVDIGVSLNTGTVTNGLPNFVSSFFKQKPVPFTYTSTCRTANFTSASINTATTGCAASAQPYAGISWIFGDPVSGATNTSTLSNPSHLFSTGGDYTVSLVYSSPCGGNDTIKTKVTVSGCIGIEELFSHTTPGTVYPNPASNLIYLTTEEPATLQLYDNTGTLVLDASLPDGKQGTDISQLSAGIYAVRIITKIKTTATRFIKTD